MIIHVRNFGKIESADIDLSDLVVFVGENNSGKTYLMQLIYGLFSFFYSTNFNETDEINQVFHDLKTENGQMIIQKDNLEFYCSLQAALNSHIEQNKNAIIERVFHTNTLTIDSLSVEVNALSDDLSLSYDGKYKDGDNSFKRYTIRKNDKLLHTFEFHEPFPQNLIDHITIRELMSILLSELTGLSISESNRKRDEKSFIYLPASRSGIMLLYANYLSNDERNHDSEKEEFTIEGNTSDGTENEYGLTQPVYDFLMFLLKHKNSELALKNYQDLLSFIDEHIINGHLDKVGNAMRYRPDQSDQPIPIFLSSSLVSEIAPIYQVISGIRRFSYIMYDEIETCQHPTKQLQLARLLVRMVNKGLKMVVSTHSDTMAAAINNLITLSFKENRAELISRLGYEEADMLQSDNIKAYHFEIGDNGKTKVIELQGHFSVGIGFDFDLFNKTNDKIYQDAKAIAEVE